tara:strand:+ start:8557 stop:8715 length:159 start_codon:yes stop_codon:yes gene_type:complete
MKIILKFLQTIMYRSKISHETFGHKIDHFFEVLEYQSLHKKNLEDRNTFSIH